jgi:hypothetical protein
VGSWRTSTKDVKVPPREDTVRQLEVVNTVKTPPGPGREPGGIFDSLTIAPLPL